MNELKKEVTIKMDEGELALVLSAVGSFQEMYKECVESGCKPDSKDDVHFCKENLEFAETVFDKLKDATNKK